MSRTRTFIAVELVKPIRDQLFALQKDLSHFARDVKWTEPENLHVTLNFLGEVGDTDLPAICRLVSDRARGFGPFHLNVEALGCFPHVRRPRVLWVGVGAGAEELVRLHDALEGPLFDLGCRREDRRFTPHVTLGRIKSTGPVDALSAEIQKRPRWQGGSQEVRALHVMGSTLTPQGPRYVVIGRAGL
jgi:2'-5' RNA ligase